jgi:hypothetical protein
MCFEFVNMHCAQAITGVLSSIKLFHLVDLRELEAKIKDDTCRNDG